MPVLCRSSYRRKNLTGDNDLECKGNVSVKQVNGGNSFLAYL